MMNDDGSVNAMKFRDWIKNKASGLVLKIQRAKALPATSKIDAEDSDDGSAVREIKALMQSLKDRAEIQGLLSLLLKGQ